MLNVKYTLFLVLFLPPGNAFSQTNYNRLFTGKTIDYSELPNPKGSDAAAWEKVPAGIQVSFANIDLRYSKCDPPAIPDSASTWMAVAWKGERVHTQLLLWSAQPINNLQVKASSLTNGKGHVIPASAVTAGFERYVLADGLNKEGHGCGILPRNESDSFLVADGIDLLSQKTVEACNTQPVWISVQVPHHSAPGNYSGRLYIHANGQIHTLAFVVQVKDHVLPPPSAWTYHLDLWQNPFAVARVYGVKDWSKEHFEQLKPYMQMLAGAGQKTITVSMIHDPWRGQTFDIYKSMIRWIKKKDGAWVYDYHIFDAWVQFMMQQGIDRLINCYTMVPWNNRFYYYDEALEKDTVLVAKTGTPEYEAHWRPMLTDFIKHLKQKGWYTQTAIAMDERPLEDMQKVIALVRSIDKNIKISLAGSYHAEITGDIYDYCIASAEHFDSLILQKRIAAGLPTTFYTYCWDGHPNTFTFSPPAESAWLAWYAANKQYNGYLRWAYNCWPQHPMKDARYSTWSAGDTYFIYPGGTSIRFERLIEGIQDYEKILVLKKIYKNNPGKLQPLLQVIKTFEITALDKQSAAGMLQQAKAVLNKY